MTTGPITVAWKSFVPDVPSAFELPATFGTPSGNWTYGAATDLIVTSEPCEVVIKAQSLKGKIGISLLSEDYSKLASKEQMISPDQGATTIVLAFVPDKSPARLLVRNYGDGGNAGEVRIDSAEIRPTA
jgi:hypothetical protein